MELHNDLHTDEVIKNNGKVFYFILVEEIMAQSYLTT